MFHCDLTRNESGVFFLSTDRPPAQGLAAGDSSDIQAQQKGQHQHPSLVISITNTAAAARVQQTKGTRADGKTTCSAVVGVVDRPTEARTIAVQCKN